jgi:hypothetical protein
MSSESRLDGRFAFSENKVPLIVTVIRLFTKAQSVPESGHPLPDASFRELASLQTDWQCFPTQKIGISPIDVIYPVLREGSLRQ